MTIKVYTIVVLHELIWYHIIGNTKKGAHYSREKATAPKFDLKSSYKNLKKVNENLFAISNTCEANVNKNYHYNC